MCNLRCSQGHRRCNNGNAMQQNPDFEIEKGVYGEYILDPNKYIMEIKTLGSLPLWFTKILTELKIYPKSFSKYGNIYKKESGVKC